MTTAAAIRQTSSPPPSIEPLFSRSDFAAVLRLSLRSFDRLATGNRLPKPDVYVGDRSPRWFQATVRTWLEQQAR
jgi:predicted DNA-binding transcriptional regulator AlpA